MKLMRSIALLALLLMPSTASAQVVRRFDSITLIPRTAPAHPTEGQSYYDSSAKAYKVWNGTAWITLGSGGGSLPTDAGFNSVAIPSGATATFGMFQWQPTDFTNQNGAFTFRNAMQTNPFQPGRRDDTVSMGWNQNGEKVGGVYNGNSSGLTFESFYTTNAGDSQSETYFTVGDGLGHGHRPYAIYYDVDVDVDTQIFQGTSFFFTDQVTATENYLSIGGGSISSAFVNLNHCAPNGRSATCFASAHPTDAVVDLALQPKANGKIYLATSDIGVSAPLITDGSRYLASGSFKGSTTVMATVSGSVTNAHLAKWDASGNLVDGGSAGGTGCTVAGASGQYQYNDGAGGCAADDTLKRVNSSAVRIQNAAGDIGSISQLLINDGTQEAMRLMTQGGGGGQNRLTAASTSGGALDTAVAFVNGVPGAVEINNGAAGNTTGTTLNVGAYKVGGTPGVTKTCTTITSITITNGIITAVSGSCS